MSFRSIRARFAPAPTGMMHIGNVRTALLNFMFAAQKKGTFVLRVEDTDAERNFDPEARHILQDLAWLGIVYNEGPGKSGDFGPYFQSERIDIYKQKLHELEQKKSIYRCFCTIEELEKKRTRQIALKQPPRYDQSCLQKKEEEIDHLLEQQIPFVWRFHIDQSKSVTVTDFAKGTVTFDYAHFSDFPITRQDGSFTFLFANAIDDIMMEISHVFRGEDHLSNTALQAAIFGKFSATLPTYWHMPMLCNIDGKKLSKRDFGFSLRQLKEAGYLPEAIVNYLAILGISVQQEIMDLETLITSFDFFSLSSGSSTITYDSKKLEWINHHWIQKKSAKQLMPEIRSFLSAAFGDQVHTITDLELTEKIVMIQPELKTLQDAIVHFRPYFEEPIIDQGMLLQHLSQEKLYALKTIINVTDLISNPEIELSNLKKTIQGTVVKIPDIYHFFRLALINQTSGPSIVELISFLGKEKAKKRIEKILQIIK
jgi:nondiscriminating glutamyl-tRNA synthetase